MCYIVSILSARVQCIIHTVYTVCAKGVPAANRATFATIAVYERRETGATAACYLGSSHYSKYNTQQSSKIRDFETVNHSTGGRRNRGEGRGSTDGEYRGRGYRVFIPPIRI